MNRLMFLVIISASLLYGGEWQLAGFEGEEIHSVAVHPTDPNIIFVGGDNLYKTIEGGWMWDTVADFRARSIIFKPSYPDTMYAINGEGSYSDGVYRSTDGGDSWGVLHYFYNATCVAVPSWPPGIIVAGSKGGGVHRSDDCGNTWYDFNDSLQNLNVLSLETLSPFDNGAVFLAGTEDGIYSCFQEYWVRTNSPDNLPVLGISVFNDCSPLVWAAIDGGSGSDGVYKSIDFGQSWEVSHWFIYATDVLVNPVDSETVYAADSGCGVITTQNGGNDWCYMNENLGCNVVYCLAQSPADVKYLYAGTQNGFYVYGFEIGVIEEAAINLRCFPNPSRSDCSIVCDEPASITVYDITGRIIESLHYKPGKPHKISFDAKNTSRGIYFIVAKVGDRCSTGRVVFLGSPVDQ